MWNVLLKTPDNSWIHAFYTTARSGVCGALVMFVCVCILRMQERESYVDATHLAELHEMIQLLVEGSCCSGNVGALCMYVCMYVCMFVKNVVPHKIGGCLT
jgi:hypothetical protein